MRRIVRIAVTGLLMAWLLPASAYCSEDTLTIPAGSALQIRLTTTLSSKTTQNGDPWMGRVVEPIFASGREVVPTGSTVEGRVTYVKEPGRVKGAAQMRLVAETITTQDEGARYLIVASLEDAQGAGGTKVKGEEGTITGPGKSKKDTAVDAGVGAGAGAGVGAITHGGTGALYGAGIGAVASVVRSLAKRHKDIVLPQGTELTFVISRTTVAKRVPSPATSSTSQQ